MDRENVRDMIKQMTMIEPDEQGVEFCQTIKPTVDIHGSTMKAGESGGGQSTLEANGECEISSKFRFSGVIGQGGMGFVSRAVQLELGREVAMKRLHTNLSESPKHKKSFLEEATVLGHLDHPNIVPIYGCSSGNDDAELTLAMKLVGGRTWAALLHGQEFRVAEHGVQRDHDSNLGILLNVCNAIGFAHSRGIIHRDIKPENVMVGEFGEVLILDWGISVSISPEPNSNTMGQLPHWRQATTLTGTPGYMPPEMVALRAEDLGPWTDIYMMGAVLFEIFARRVPHEGSTLTDVLEAIVNGVGIRYPEDMPEAIQDICKKSMAHATVDRYQSIREFADAIQEYMSNRESMVISNTANKVLQNCREKMAVHGNVSDDEQGKLYSDFNDAIAGFRQAIVLWQTNNDAVDGEHESRSLYAEAALTNGDLSLAYAQLDSLGEQTSTDLRARINEAMRTRDRAALASKTLKRTILSAVALVLVLLLSGGFMLMTMNSINATIASDVRTRLIEHAEQYLHVTSEQAAVTTQLKIGKVKLAIQALSDKLEEVMSADYVYASVSPESVIWGPDIDDRGTTLPGFYEDPEYARTVDGVPEPNPISFEALSYSVPIGVTADIVHDQIERCEELLPLLRTLDKETKGVVKRYWAAFESGLLFLYPAAGNVPEDYSPTDRSRYRDAVNSFSLTQSRPYQHFGTQQVVITFAKMARDINEERFGQMGLHVNIDDLVHVPDLPFDWQDAAKIQILQRVANPETGVESLVIVADEAYQSASRELNLSHYDVMLEPLELTSRDYIESQLLAGHSGVGRDEIHGEAILYAFAPVLESIDGGQTQTSTLNSYLITIPESVVIQPAVEFEQTIRSETGAKLFRMAMVVLGVFLVVLLLLWAVPRLMPRRVMS